MATERPAACYQYFNSQTVLTSEMEEEPEHSVCCWQTCHSLVAMASSFPLQCCSQKAACPGLLACPEVTVTILHVETGAALSDPCGSLPAWDMSNMTLRHPRMTTSSYSN